MGYRRKAGFPQSRLDHPLGALILAYDERMSHPIPPFLDPTRRPANRN
jgi:hypothetical protein